MADLTWCLGVRPHGPKFSQFHAVFWKIWQNRIWAPSEGLMPLPRGILDPPLLKPDLFLMTFNMFN